MQNNQVSTTSESQTETKIKGTVKSQVDLKISANSRKEDVGDTKAYKNNVSKVTESEHDSTSSQNNQSRLHPFVHWAQSQTHISLRIDLIQARNLNVLIEEDGVNLKFSAQGRGAHGLQDYFFSLTFHSEVEREKFDCQTIERYVLILIKKVQPGNNWPRLTKQTSKLPWLRVDFDRYAGDDSSSSDNDNSLDKDYKDEVQSFPNKDDQAKFEQLLQQLKQGNTNSKLPESSNSWSRNLNNIFAKRNLDLINPFKKQFGLRNSANMKYDYRKETVSMDSSKNTSRHALDGKKTYLFIYNLVMFIMFLKVYIVLLIKITSGTIDDDIVKGAAFIVRMLTFTQLLESIHPMLGLVPGGPLMPITQVIGRLLVNEFLTDESIRKDAFPYAHYLFVVWSSIEICRYSYYALHVFKVNVYALTWCRYSLFLPLYPCGGFCETMVVLSTIKIYEKTGTYSVSLPNAANISFNLPLVLKFYLIVLLWPTIYFLIKYMLKQRSKQLKEKVV